MYTVETTAFLPEPIRNSALSTLLYAHDAFLDHDTGHGHPERPDRFRSVMTGLAAPEFAALRRRVERAEGGE